MENFEHFKSYLNERGYSHTTVRGYTKERTSFIKWTATENIQSNKCTYNELLSYVNHCRAKGNSKRTMNQKLNSLRHYFNYLIEAGARKDNPAAELRIKNTIRNVPHDLLTKEALENIYRSYPANGITGKRNKAMLGLMIYQGATTAELTAIEVKDIKLEEGTVYLPATGRLPGKKLGARMSFANQTRPALVTTTLARWRPATRQEGYKGRRFAIAEIR